MHFKTTESHISISDLDKKNRMDGFSMRLNRFDKRKTYNWFNYGLIDSIQQCPRIFTEYRVRKIFKDTYMCDIKPGCDTAVSRIDQGDSTSSPWRI